MKPSSSDSTARATLGLRRLYEQFVGPLDLPRTDLLVIIPDGILHLIPFAALVDERGASLIESTALVISPSLRLYLGTNRKPHLVQLAEALVVADPEFTAEKYPELPRLLFAREEGRSVLAIYQGGLMVEGREASREVVLRGLEQFPVVHYAGHAVVNDEFPRLSRLVLGSSSSGEESDLYADDLLLVAHTKTQVAVLAACETAGGRIRSGEGPLSLARAFLGAGVPSVIASLWPVDDRAGQELWLTFHRELRDGRSPAEALRRAQVRSLKQGTSPYIWGAFATYGAS